MKLTRGMLLGGALTAVLFVVAGGMARRRRIIDFKGRVVLITGASRGLGFILARNFASEGAHLVICARGKDEVDRAKVDLVGRGARVLAVTCDVSDRAQVEDLVQLTLQQFGRIDVVVNNAGIIQVGPVETMNWSDYDQAVAVNAGGALNVTLTALPHLRAGARIMNVTSIGGEVAIPHLLPYSISKFAMVGFSEGLAAEVAKRGVRVVTVVPGLMRTGSFVNALFKGKVAAELNWFALGASLPLVSMDAERAARKMVQACASGRAYVTIGMPAKILRLAHAIAPGWVNAVLSRVNRLLPKAGDAAYSGRSAQPGWMHETELRLVRATALGRRAARKFNER